MRYKVYTKKYDEEVRPLDLMSQCELDSKAAAFHRLCPVENFEPLRERLEAMKAPEEPTIVSLLIDNSGSMRGAPITFAIGAVGIIGMYLDKLNIPNEILGFTTVSWKGGKPREEWHLAGRPRNPGRLNALRHIVYKDAKERLIDVRSNLALMMSEGLLKENVDGEAVQWAIKRLRRRKAKRRILLVISDGAPVDDSTLSVNFKKKDVVTRTEEIIDGEIKHREYKHERYPFLSDHLKSVIQKLNKKGDICLDAIGVGHDVSGFYGVGDRINKLEELAPTAIAKLEAMLQ